MARTGNEQPAHRPRSRPIVRIASSNVSRLIRIALLLATSLAIGNCAPSPVVPGDLSRIYHDEIAAKHDRIVDREGLIALVTLYQRHFVGPLSHLGMLNDDDVEAGYLAAYNAAFYAHYHDPTSRDTFLLDAGRYFSELSRRGKTTDRYARFMHHLYMSSRRFDEAESIRRGHPDAGIPAMPLIDTDASFDADRPGVYTLNGDGNGFRLKNVHPDLSRTIVIVAGCPISRRAAGEIQANPSLRQAFADGNAIWLGSADTLDLEQVRQWNAELPHSPLHVVHDQQQWPNDIDFTAHPNFHFFVDGKRVAFHSGWWPLEGAPEPIIAGLKAMGVWPNAR